MRTPARASFWYARSYSPPSFSPQTWTPTPRSAAFDQRVLHGLVTPEVPAGTAPAAGAAPETWILHPVAASSTTARDAAAGRALRRNMDGILLSGPREPLPGRLLIYPGREK